MDINLNLDSLLDNLESDDPETLLAALDAGVDLFGRFSEKAVQKIKHPQMGIFVAERLHSLVSTLLKRLEVILQTSAKIEEKAHAGALLLFFGSKSGVPTLRELVERGHALSTWAAHKLANAGVSEVKESIVFRLRGADLKKTAEITSLLSALKKVNGDLPLDLENRFLSEEASDEIRECILAEWTPPEALLPPEPSTNALRV